MSARRVLLAAVFSLATGLFWAQAPGVPDAGLRAEAQGRWEDAVTAYRQVILQNPNRPDLWVRVADIRAKQGQPGEAAAALEEASRLSPGDDFLLFKLSQAYAVDARPKEAQAAIRRALAIKPAEPDYLRAAGEIASWNADYSTARDCYTRLLQVAPGDPTALLGLARVQMWSGKLDDAVCSMNKYLEGHPGDKVAWMLLAQAETWRGNYPAAMKVLDRFRKDFGETDDYVRQKALVLVLARRSQDALVILDPLIHKAPDDFLLQYANTIALANGRRPDEAVKSLDTLARLKPGDPLANSARLYVLTPLKSWVRPGFLYSHDSDGVDISRFTLDASFQVNPATQMVVGGERDRETAPVGSGLESPDNSAAYMNMGYVGFRHRFSPDVSLDATLGGAQVEGGSSSAVYTVGADFNPSDQVTLRLERLYGFYGVSPRALSLGIKQAANQFQVHADMGLTWHLDALAGYDTYSDGNERWELAIGPRASVLRTEAFNLDLGVRAWWFGFKDDMNNGYYDPNQYQRYAVTAYGYWKISDNDGLSIMLAPGLVKDSGIQHLQVRHRLRPGRGLRHLPQLVPRGEVSHIDNNRVASGAYQGTTGQISLLAVLRPGSPVPRESPGPHPGSGLGAGRGLLPQSFHPR